MGIFEIRAWTMWRFSILLAFSLSLSAARAENRVALVIGNNDYLAAGRLNNPVRDAASIAKSLQDVGFQSVQIEQNLTREGLLKALRQFEQQVDGADWALIYYAGHGIEVGGINYLMPTDARLKSDRDVDEEAVSLSQVQKRLEGARKIRLVILDACRDNPLLSSMKRTLASRSVGRGLARPDLPQTGSLVAFSAGVSQTASDGGAGELNSPYVASLIKHLATPDLEVNLFFRRVRADVLRATGNKQEPATYESLPEERFVLHPAKAGSSVAAVVAPTIAAAAEVAGSEKRPLGIDDERRLAAAQSFQECPDCPEMIKVPTGSFSMGTSRGERGGENPAQGGRQLKVTIAQPFAVGKYEVTFREWDFCVRDGGCAGYRPSDKGWGRERRPVINISWYDAKNYIMWLSKKTGKDYRLLSSAEWEYAARGGTTTPFWWGKEITPTQANYSASVRYGSTPAGLDRKKTLPVGSFSPNPFGLFDVHGNVEELVEDCNFNGFHRGFPSDGSPDIYTDCSGHLTRGGSWNRFPADIRAGLSSVSVGENDRDDYIGFRIARTLSY